MSEPQAGAPPAITVRDLRTQFGPQVVHDGLSMSVRRGEVLGLVGGSGTGKSVLLREMIGLLRPAAGHIEVMGHAITGSAAERQRAQRHWGVLFQDGALFSSLSVAENIEMPLRERTKLAEGLYRDLAALKLALVGLPAYAGAKKPAELSGGMRKRAGLARALALDPAVVFLDEPTAGLDPIGAHDFDRLIRDLQTSLGLTVVMITHDLDSLTMICDRVAVLVDKQVRVATIDEHKRSNHPWINAYFNGPRARAVSQHDSGRGEIRSRAVAQGDA